MPRKTATATKPGRKSIILKTEEVDIRTLKMYYKNARIGDVDKIADSLNENGQYKPIVINIGTKTGRENEILAGNNTWLGARRLGWETLDGSFVDVDEDRARIINLVDNKTSDDGEYDDKLLAEALSYVPPEDLKATGYKQDEIDAIVKRAGALVQSTLDAMPSAADILKGVEINGDKPRDPREVYASERDNSVTEAAQRRGASMVDLKNDQEINDINDIPDVSAEVQVVLELKEDEIYKGNNAWGIPDLLPDKLLEDVPPDLTTWGGLEATPDDGKKWFLYNYSLGGLKGLPFDRTILSFFTHDKKFMNWWEYPAYYTAKVLSKGLKIAIVPDFSFYYTETRTHHLWGVYKAQWLGRFFQEAGLLVIPRLQCDYRDPNTLEIAMLGIPRQAPVIATSIQNLEGDEANSKSMTSLLKEALEELEPKKVLVYGGNPGWKSAEMTGYTKGDLIHIPNYADVRREIAFGKKEGKKRLTAKQRKEIQDKYKEQNKSENESQDDELLAQPPEG